MTHYIPSYFLKVSASIVLGCAVFIAKVFFLPPTKNLNAGSVFAISTDFNEFIASSSYDFQAGALEIPHESEWCSEDGAYTTIGMTPEGEKICCSPESVSRNDVWFKFQASSEEMELEVQRTGDSPIRAIIAGVYDANLAELACGSYTQQTVNLALDLAYTGLTIGEWYYIKVDNYYNLYGDFSLCMRGGKQGTAIYCISSGNWNDPNIWSYTKNGTSAYTIPRISDDVWISGFDVVVNSNQECRKVTITNKTSSSLVQVIGGTLQVNEAIEIRNENPENGLGVMKVLNNGRIEILKEE